MKTTIEFSTDGGKTWKHCNELRVDVNNCALDENEKDIGLYFNFTDEGLIIDRFLDNHSLDKTYSHTYEEIYEDMY